MMALQLLLSLQNSLPTLTKQQALPKAQ